MLRGQCAGCLVSPQLTAPTMGASSTNAVQNGAGDPHEDIAPIEVTDVGRMGADKLVATRGWVLGSRLWYHRILDVCMTEQASQERKQSTLRLRDVVLLIAALAALSCRAKHDNTARAEQPSNMTASALVTESPESTPAGPALTTPPGATSAPAGVASSLALPQNQELSTMDVPRASSRSVRAMPVEEQQAYVLELLRVQEELDDAAVRRLQQWFAGSPWLSFGNPKVSRAPLSKEECLQRRTGAARSIGEPRCGAPNMVPLYDPNRGQTAADANVCIDQYEFPNVECEYPVVWARAHEAAGICQALGKRLCDAHEWEGACAGALRPVASEYPWAQMPTGLARSTTRERRLWMEYEHNRTREVRWAYGEEQDHTRCATGARKSSACSSNDWRKCGTSTYPSGSFPECVSTLGVYDQHGNVAEHMSLPLSEDELASKGGVGWTEMKGSWFVFGGDPSHPDDCRWRAKSWHTTRTTELKSHRSYHLGFRCCKDIE